MISPDRLYLNAEEDEVLPEGHPDARVLLCGVGGVVDDVRAKLLGILNTRGVYTPPPKYKAPVVINPPASPAINPPGAPDPATQ